MYCLISDHEMNPRSLPERLRALPGFTPPAGGWARLQQRRDSSRRRFAAAGAGLALAASVLVAVGLVTLEPAPAPGPAAAQKQAVAQLISRSQTLEQRLARARPQVAVWDSRRAARADTLERQLTVVDAQLNYADPESAVRLWRERVHLMDALVDLHQPEQAALRYASYQY